MPTTFAFLRGINVGNRRPKMTELAAILEDGGLGEVQTFLASGNVIVEAKGDQASLETRIEALLHEGLGYEVRTTVRSADQLRQVTHQCPFPPLSELPKGHGLHVALFKAPPDDDLTQRIEALNGPADHFSFVGRELYWHVEGKMSESPVGDAFMKALRHKGTVRTMNTLNRLLKKYAPGAP